MDLNEFIFAETSKREENFYGYDMTLIGRSGAGKSTLAVQLFKDDCCLFDVERGNKQASGVYKKEPKNWKDIKDTAKDWAKAIKRGHKPPFTVLLFDTQTKLQLMCQEYVMDTNGWDDMAQGDDGVNRWNVLKREYTSVMDSFRQMGFKIVRICHGKDKKFKPRGQEEYNQYTADVGATFDYDVLGAVDFVFYLEKIRVKDDNGVEKEVRRLILQNDMDYNVKCRFPELPDEIIYETPEECVEKFYEAWEMALNSKDGKVHKPKPVKDMFATKVEVEDEDDDDEQHEPEPTPPTTVSELSLEELITQAEETRDRMLEEGMSKEDMKALLKEELGTFVIKKCKDIDKLKAFINK